MDTVSRQKRSEIMRAVRSRGNKVTELAFARLLRAHRITGWRRHAALTGKPDFVFRKVKIAVFVDGCFWHGCTHHCRMPKGHGDYWLLKIASNKVRDRQVNQMLRRTGWRVLRIWEHESVRKGEARLIRRLRQALPELLRHPQ